MDQGLLESLTAQVIEKILPKYPRLALVITLIPAKKRLHTFSRIFEIQVIDKDIQVTYQLGDLYAPPGSDTSVIMMELEALLQLHIQQFLHEQREKLRRTALKMY